MRQKPKFMIFMTMLFIALGISFPIQIMLVYDYQIWDLAAIFSKITPLNYIIIFMLMGCAYLTYTANKLIFICLPVINFLIFLNNFIVAEYSQLYSHAQTLTASTAFLMVTLSFYQKDIYRVYNDIKFRWWLTSPRYHKEVPVVIEYNGETFHCKSYDISQTGMFIHSDDLYRVFKINNHDEINLKLQLPKTSVDLVARVVRKSIAKGNYPAGIGVHFNEIKSKDLSTYNRKVVKTAA